MTDEFFFFLPERAVCPLFSELDTHPWPGPLGTPSLCYIVRSWHMEKIELQVGIAVEQSQLLFVALIYSLPTTILTVCITLIIMMR